MVEMREFFAKFIAVFLALYVFFHIPALVQPFGVNIDFLYPLELFVALSVTALLNLFGIDASLQGLTIQTGPVMFTLIADCTGVVSLAIFAGLMHATPMKKKLYYLALSFPLFVLWNIVRVTLTLGFGSALTDLLHSLLWVASVLIVLALYVLVLKKEKVYLGGK